MPPDKRLSDRLRVFVSSRMAEMRPERGVIRKALDDLEVDAWVFERDAGARTESIETVFLEQVEQADLYIGLFWKGYGEYTIAEYEHAQALGKPCLVYEKRASIEDRDAELQRFLDRIGQVETGLTIQWFNSPDELRALVKKDVAAWQVRKIRHHPEEVIISIADLPAALEHFVGRVKELEDLDAAWENDETNVISLVAFGGVGKSALVGEWLRRLGRDGWRGARYVLGHSFYYLSPKCWAPEQICRSISVIS